MFNAIADPTRRAILWQLRDGDRSAGELQAPLDVSQSAFSQHLGVLKAAGLVSSIRDGRRQIYRIQPDALAEVAAWITHFDRFWTERLDRLGALLDRQGNARGSKRK